MIKSYKNHAFTLIELSIVLIVIGLIIGGIVVGRHMIRQSQVMSMMVDVQSYTSAVSNFQKKYNALPGDMVNATSFWGSVTTPTNGNTCYQAVGTGTQTCDGNGNGQIDWCSYESGRAWQHLANAGMIQGAYPQSGAGTCWTWSPGVDVPTPKIGGAYFMMGYKGTVVYSGVGPLPADFPAVYNHVILLTGSTTGTGALSSSEAQGFDTKYDDGSPSSGNVLTPASTGYSYGCTTNVSYLLAQYVTNATSNVCQLYFITGF